MGSILKQLLMWKSVMIESNRSKFVSRIHYYESQAGPNLTSEL